MLTSEIISFPLANKLYHLGDENEQVAFINHGFGIEDSTGSLVRKLVRVTEYSEGIQTALYRYLFL